MNTNRAFPGSSIERLEPRIAPAANLVAAIISAPDIGVPGQGGSVTFTLTNEGDENAVAPPGRPTGMHLYFSVNDTLGAGDPIIGRVENVSFNLKPGESKQLTGDVQLPAATLPNPQFPPGAYNILVEVDVPNRIGETTTRADNVDASPIQLFYQFGKIGDKDARLRITDANGTGVSFSIEGPGTGELKLIGSGASQQLDLELTNTTDKSIVRVFGSGGADDGRITIRNLTAGSAFKSGLMPDVNVIGMMSFPAGFARLTLADIGYPLAAGDQTLTIGNAPFSDVEMFFRRVADLDINSAIGLTTLKVDDWLNTDGNPDEITAPSLQKLFTVGSIVASTPGDFGANLTLSGGASRFTLDSAKIGGKLANTTWMIGIPGGSPDQRAGTIEAGEADQWVLRARGAVDSLIIADNLQHASQAMATIEALYFGSIKVGGLLDADIKVNGASPRDVKPRLTAIASLNAGRVDSVDIDAAMGGILGISVDEWIGGGTITTKFILTLKTRGEDSAGNFDANLELAGPDFVGGNVDAPKGVNGAIGKASIAGAILGGTWNVKTEVTRISAESTAAGWTFNGALASGGGDLGQTQLETIKISGVLDGSLKAERFNKIIAKGALTADISGGRDFGGAEPGISSLTAGIVGAANINVQGTIKTLHADSWNGGTLTSPRVESFTIGDAKAGVVGDLVNATVNGRFDRLTVNGSIMNSTFAIGFFESIRAREWMGGSLTAPSGRIIEITGGAGVRGDFTANLTITGPLGGDNQLSAFEVKGFIQGSMINVDDAIRVVEAGGMQGVTLNATRVGELTIRGVADFAGPFFAGTNIATQTMGHVILRDVDEATTGTPYGIRTGEVTIYERFTGKQLAESLREVTGGGTLDEAGDYQLIVT